MDKRWLLNLSLLGIIAVLGLIALWRPGIQKPVTTPLVATVKTEQINRIIITRARAADIELQRNADGGGSWKMVRPVPGRTSLFVVSDMLRILTAKNQQSLPAEAASQLNRYGLDPARARLQLDQLEILFGDTHPVSNLQYVLVQGRVAMIDSGYFRAATRRYTDYLSKRLIEKDRRPIALSLPNVRLSLKKGTWQAHPEQKDLSADRIKQLVDQWRYAQALSVKKYNDDRVLDWVQLSFAGETKRLRIGILSRSPKLILYRPDEKLQYYFPQDVGKRLFSVAE
ncbi:MAG: DUF4340 domain-containing protein [Acidiferrobacterales bacterium]